MLRSPVFAYILSSPLVGKCSEWRRWCVGLATAIVMTPAMAMDDNADNATAADGAISANGANAQVVTGAEEPSLALPGHIQRALFMDPDVSAANARACQALHHLGLSRARARPQISATVSGSRQIASRIKRSEPVNLFQPASRLSPAEREIYESGAHHRQFEHRQRNNIYDGKVSLRVNLYDWGQSRANIDGRGILHDITRLEAEQKLAERSAALLNLSLRLLLLDNILTDQAVTAAAVAPQVAAVQSRVEAGVSRISELREARLLQLDLEIETNRIAAQRDQLVETLQTDFELTPDDARSLYHTYLQNRPQELAYSQAENTKKALILRLRARAIGHEEIEIRASRYPKLDGVMDGTVFDLTDYEDEYELVGKLEMTMPLYDGGAAKARLRETAWRSREIKAALASLFRDHNTEMEQINRRFNDLGREELELQTRLSELQKRLGSIEATQGKTAVSPQQLAQLHLQLGSARTGLVEIKFERESARSTALTLSEKLNDVLKIRIGDEGC